MSARNGRIYGLAPEALRPPFGARGNVAGSISLYEKRMFSGFRSVCVSLML